MTETTKLRVAVIHNRYRREGGEEAAVDSEIQLLKSYGHEVLDIYRSNKQTGRAFPWKTIAALLKSSWNRLESGRVLSRINSFKPDVVHIHNFWFSLSPAVHHLLAKAGYPVVQTLHNYRLLCVNSFFLRNGKPCEVCVERGLQRGVLYRCYNNSFFQSFLVKRMVGTGKKNDVWNRDVTNYIALTDFAKAKFVQGGIPGQKIVIKQNVVFPQRTELIRADKNPDQAIFVGRFSTEKGISVLLKASDGIRGSIVLCGTGPCLEKVLKTARNNVSVKGHIPKNELYALIHESLFLVVPSIWYEGYPMAILEAFSQGVPCVASNIGGIPEIVEDGKTGLLFEPGNADDLRDKMNMLFGNKRLCEQLGRNACETYLTKHSPESNYLRLRSIYENAIASKKFDAAIG